MLAPDLLARRRCASRLRAGVLAAGLAACAGRPPDDPPRAAAPAPAPAPAEAPQELPDMPPETGLEAPAPPDTSKNSRAALPGYLGFARACEGDARVVIAAVGDVLLHEELQAQASRSPLRWRALWQGVDDLLQGADLAYANLEVPLAAGLLRSGEEVADPGLVYDRKVYTAYPRFNAHPSVAADLVASGVDVVSTANNHALDRGPLGVDRTLAALDAAGLARTGTRARGSRGPWHARTSAGGMTIAWLACAANTNGIEDPEGQVLRCFEPRDAIAEQVRALAGTAGIDAVIVTPHWGKEYTAAPNRQQKEFARRWAEAGATAVIGSHPHVLQPWEVIATSDGREVLVVYSLGNFVSHQPELEKRSTAIVYVGLARAGGEAFVYGAGHVPVHVRRTGDEFFAEAVDRVGGPDDSRAHTVALLGEANLLRPGEPVELAPQCPRR